MKRVLFVVGTLILSVMPAIAQKYFDVYQKGKITTSIASSAIDSIGLTGNTMQNRKVNFYRDGKTINSYLANSIDSIKIFRTDEEQLVYMGIVGFNQELYEMPIDVLATSTSDSYSSFVNRLTRKDGTLLYYAVDHALDMLQDASLSTPITSVNLVTFTDGLDQGSLMMNSRYSTDEQYLDAVNKRINNTKIKGIPVTAYSVGLRGSDVSDYTLFQKNLKKLASAPEKAFEVSSMEAVRTRLQGICDQIISISNRQTFSLKIPGQSNGTLIRFTFDGNSAESSNLYIEGIFNLASRSMTNVTYHGIKATSGSYIQGTQDGIFVTFTFTGLQREDANGLIPRDYVREYYKTSGSSSWQQNSEFTPSNNTQTTITHSGAVIMLVLDCSNSLGSQFGDMKSYAQDFIYQVARNTQDFKVETPRNLIATLTNDFAIQLSWDAVKHAETYDVYRSSSEYGNYNRIASGVTENSWIDPHPLSGKNCYRVCAFGHGLYSHESNISVVNYSLDAPSNVTATILDDAFVIRVSWDGVKYADSYDVYRSSNPSSGFAKVATDLTQTTWTDNNPLAGSNYYRVYAVGHGLTSSASSTTAVVNYVLDAPSNVKAMIPNDDFVIRLSWNKAKYAESYTIYRSYSSSGTFTKIVSGITTTAWADPSPLLGYNCYYVCAVGHGLTSPASNKTDVVDYSLASPSNAKAVLSSNFEVIVSWDAVNHAEGYDIYRSSNASSGFTKVAAKLNATQWKDPSPLHGSNYYRIYAVAKNMVSEPSITTNVVNYSIAAPTNVKAFIPDEDFVIRVSWNAVTYAESYDIYRSSNASSGFTKVANGIISTQWTDNNPLHGNNYYRIYAIGHGLTSEASNTSSVVDYSLDAPQNLIAKYNPDDNSVSLTWNTVKHAEGYDIYRGNNLIATVTSNYWKDNNPPSGEINYSVNATSHSLKSGKSSTTVIVSSNDKISITYSGSAAYVSISPSLADYVNVTINGGHVSVFQSENLLKEVTYELKGSSSNGSFFMDGNYKAIVELVDLTLTNPTGAAIDIENGKRIAFLIKGINRISDGANGTHKATIYNNGHSLFDGDGTLEIYGYTKHAMKTDERVIVKNGTICVRQAAGDGLNINERLQVDGGKLNISSNGDAIDVSFRGVNKGTMSQYERNGYIDFNGGSITASCSGQGAKAIKADGNIIINGASVNATTSGNAYYNYAEADISSCSAIKTGGEFQMSSGILYATSTGDGGKGINVTGPVNITGGDIYVTTTGIRFDYGALDTKPQGIKSDGNITISGGNVYVCAGCYDGNATAFKPGDTAIFTINGGTIMGISRKKCTVSTNSIQGTMTASGQRITAGQTFSLGGVSYTIPSGYSITSANVIVSRSGL